MNIDHLEKEVYEFLMPVCIEPTLFMKLMNPIKAGRSSLALVKINLIEMILLACIDFYHLELIIVTDVFIFPSNSQLLKFFNV